MEILVCCVFAYWLMKHAPELAGEAAGAFMAGLHGTETPAMKDRRERLQGQGIDPASGGAFGQFAGNVWRDFWLDQDRKRANKQRAAAVGQSAEQERGWWSKKMDEAIDRQSAKWRSRKAGSTPGNVKDPGGGGNAPKPPSDPPHSDQNPTADSTPDPITVESTIGDPGATPGDPSTAPNPGDSPAPLGPPIRVDSTLGSPASDLQTQPGGVLLLDPPRSTAPANNDHQPGPSQELDPGATSDEPKGTQPMSNAVATRGIQVTGVVSGAQETQLIYNEMVMATTEFERRMVDLSARMMSLGEQTLSIVQFGSGSDVMTRMSQAAEALAAVRAAARGCGNEVLPLLTATRVEFTRRNS